MGIESAAAAIDFAGLIDKPYGTRTGERSSTPRRRSSMASMSMKLLLPNGSRLSCGRRVRRRKAVERQIKRLAGEATPFLPTCERPAASSAC